VVFCAFQHTKGVSFYRIFGVKIPKRFEPTQPFHTPTILPRNWNCTLPSNVVGKNRTSPHSRNLISARFTRGILESSGHSCINSRQRISPITSGDWIGFLIRRQPFSSSESVQRFNALCGFYSWAAICPSPSCAWSLWVVCCAPSSWTWMRRPCLWPELVDP
jgi:hypothetical protein